MKIIRIEKCGECPYSIPIVSKPTYWCEEAQRYFVPVDTIPEWCPLEDEEVEGG